LSLALTVGVNTTADGLRTTAYETAQKLQDGRRDTAGPEGAALDVIVRVPHVGHMPA